MSKLAFWILIGLISAGGIAWGVGLSKYLDAHAMLVCHETTPTHLSCRAFGGASRLTCEAKEDGSGMCSFSTFHSQMEGEE